MQLLQNKERFYLRSARKTSRDEDRIIILFFVPIMDFVI